MAEAKTALVLSAGGMFGAYQAGAYRAIFEHAPPDIVVGASVGALNGWPIAARCLPRDLTERWLDPAAGAALSFRNPEPLRRQCEEIFAAFQPVIPFGLVLIERPKFRTVLVQTPHVTAAHLQGSCSIPLFLPSARVNGINCMDGGLFEKLPVWAAVEMGATRIIAIDSLPDLGLWWLRAGMKAIRIFRPRPSLPIDLDLTILSPSEALGSARDAVFWKRENVQRWIEMGEQDALRALTTRLQPTSVCDSFNPHG